MSDIKIDREKWLAFINENVGLDFTAGDIRPSQLLKQGESDYVLDVALEEITQLREQLAKYERVYAAARGLCMGYDWNKGTHAKLYRNMLIDLIDSISPLPDKDGHKLTEADHEK